MPNAIIVIINLNSATCKFSYSSFFHFISASTMHAIKYYTDFVYHGPFAHQQEVHHPVRFINHNPEVQSPVRPSILFYTFLSSS